MSSIETTFRSLIVQLSPMISISLTSWFAITNQYITMQLTALVTTLLSLVLFVDKEMVLEWLDKIYLRNIVEKYVFRETRFKKEFNVWYVPQRKSDIDSITSGFNNIFRIVHYIGKNSFYDTADGGIAHIGCTIDACSNYKILKSLVKEKVIEKYGSKITITFHPIKPRTPSGNDWYTKENFMKYTSYFKVVVHSNDTSVIDKLVTGEADNKIQKNKISITNVNYSISSKNVDGKDVVEKQISSQTCQSSISKTRKNLSLSHDIEDKLFSRVELFLSSEDVYARRGIPYTCGFILYGPPGTGKTSIIKTLAVEYKLPLIIANLNEVENTTDLRAMFTEIQKQTSSHEKYLLIFEDFDRAKFFHEKKCMDLFYNLLDGVEEMSGRIAIITCNNELDILNDSALFRPGRFDEALHISYADRDQIERMMRVFYDDQEITFSDDNFKSLKRTWTPAQIQNVMFNNFKSVDGAKKELAAT